MEAKIIKESSVREWMIANDKDLAKSAVQVNTNGYPFITFFKGGQDDSAENIYFSKAAAEAVRAGDSIKDLGLGDYRIMELDYGNGETRLKLTNKSGGALDLDAIFG
jgi:hypothetical protein